jgi:ferric-chelate reductase (NADPH)
VNLITKTLADTTARVLLRSSEITAATDHGPHFRSIELSGDGLKNATWVPGDKVQVRSNSDGLTLRTYTPTCWDAIRGSTRLLAYAHGLGPGSEWIKAAIPGRQCQLFGPRRSLALDGLGGPIVFVGDETSFAVVAAWQTANPSERPAALIFEVNDVEESAGVLDAVGISAAQLVARDTRATHLGELTAATATALRTHADGSLCLTGKAQSIARIRQTLKVQGLSGRPTRVKAYWDENRSGLD